MNTHTHIDSLKALAPLYAYMHTYSRELYTDSVTLYTYIRGNYTENTFKIPTMAKIS